MQGVDNNDFDGLKSSLDMGFTSVVQMLNIINDDNAKTRTLVGSILDRLDNLIDNIGQTFNTSLGKIGLGSFTNYSKLSYDVQMNIHKTLRQLTLLQKKMIDKFLGKKLNLSDFDSKNTQEDLHQTQGKQGAFIGGKIINTKTNIELNLLNGDKKTQEQIVKGLKEVNKLLAVPTEKFKAVGTFFTDLNTQMVLLAKNLKPAAFGFAMLASSLILLQFVSIVSIFKLAMVLPLLGIGVGLFILGIVAATKSLGGGIRGMFKFWMIMKMLPDLFTNLGKGVLLLSLGLLIFNAVGYDAILKLIGTMISLGIAFKLMAGGDDSFTGTFKLMIVAGIILATVYALVKTKDIPWDSVLKLPSFIAGLGLALRIGGFDKLGKLKLMNMLSISLLLITMSLLTFKYISWENIIKYNVFITLMGLSLRTIKKDIPILGLMAVGFMAMTAALLDFQELNWMTIIQIIGVIGLLGFVVNKFVLGRLQSGTAGNMSSSLSGGGFKGGGLIGFALGMFLLTFALERFANIHWQSVLKAITIIAVLGIVFKLFFQEKTTGFMGMKKSGIQVPSMIGFALGLGLLVLALDAVTEIEWKSVFQLVTLMVAIGLIFKFLMPQKSKTSGMLGFALGVGILLLALDAMSEIPWENVFKLVTFMTGIGVALWLIKGTGFFQMIAMAGAIYVMVYSLEYLSKIKLNANSMNAFLLFYGVVAVGLFFIGKFASKILLGAGIVLVIGWAAGVMANALAKISSLTFSLEGTLVWFGGVTLIGLAMAGIGALMMTGVGAVLVGAGALAVVVIAGASLLMAHALSAISELTYSETAFLQFSYGIGKIINAYINLDPIATVASIVTAAATIPILLASLFAIGILKLIDITFPIGYSTLPVQTFTKSLGLLITSFNDNIGLLTAGKAAAKSVLILPVLGTMFLASLVLTKISNTPWDARRLGTFNTMFSLFISDTVDTISKHKNALVGATPGIKAITQLINVASSLAKVVGQIANLKFVEMDVVNGKLVVTGVRQLTPKDFENVGKSLAKLILALVNPIKALGMDSSVWRIGSDVIPNPFKNDNFANGIDNIKKISEAFKPLVDSVIAYSKTGIAFDYGKANRFVYSLKVTANGYGYLFAKFAKIKRDNLIDDAFKTIKAIQKYNDTWSDMDYDSFKEYTKLFNSFIDKLSDANKWKYIHRNIATLTKNIEKTVKAINSIDLEKAAALQVNVQQLTDKSNNQYLKEIIEQFVNLFGIIGQNQYQQAMIMNSAGSNFLTASNNIVTSNAQTAIENDRNKIGNAEYEKIKKGESSISLYNLTPEQQKTIKEEGYDSNNDGTLSNMDVGVLMAHGDKLDKLIAILTANQSMKRFK